jgi:autotransporter translocation and assembly factor TamB
MKKKRSRVWKIIGGFILLPVVLLAFIQTPPGKTLFAKALTTALSHSDQHRIKIGTITGWIPGKVTISSLEVGDADGTWLKMEDVHFRWMIRELVNQKVYFRQLSAESITWCRFPKYGKSNPRKETSSDFQPLEIRLDDLSVSRLQLEKGVAGIPLNYAVHSGGIAYNTTGRLLGKLTVSGDAEGVVKLDALLAGSEDDQLKIMAQLDALNHPTFGLDQLSGDGEAVIKGGQVEAVITADISMQGQEGRIATRLLYEDRMLGLQQFHFNSPDYSCMGDLSLGFTNRSIDIALDTTFIDASTNRYDLRGTAVFAKGNKTWDLDLQALEICGWETLSLALVGQLNPTNVALSGTLAEMDMAAVPWAGSSNFVGTVNGSISIAGSLEKTQVDAELTIGGFSSSQDALDELPELDFRIAGGFAEGELFASTSITNYVNGHFKADVKLPCQFSMTPLRFNPDSQKVDAHVDADLDLRIFNQLAFFQNQHMSGILKANVDYEDRMPTGFLKVENGRYEHYDFGFVFRDFNADLEATQHGFVVKHASATDGGDGTVVVSGGLGPKGLGLVIDFVSAGIIRRDEVDADISGQLKVDGRLARPDLSGTLTIDRAEILLDNIAPPLPTLLTDFDSSTSNMTVMLQEKERNPPPVGLDIKISIPDQVFINASMIEAVLGGNLHIVDTPRGISVSGTIKPRRGFVNFIGKKFRYTQGEIRLDGSIPTIATLDNLTSEYSRRDVVARLVLNGRADDPSFRLESSPPLPEDEVLSHVLFNRDTSSISPYQAYQITAAARQLSGGINGPGFMYQVRQSIGIDTLEWREAEAAGESSSVAAGKYITSGFYVEINQSLDSRGETGMMAELEVTRHFSVETYTGPKMRPGIGVNWRNDY